MSIPLSKANIMEKKITELIEVEKPLVLSEETKVKEAVDLIREKSIGSVLVIDLEGKLSGIFTERDLATKVDFACNLWQDHSIKQYMTANPFFIREEDLLCDLINNMSVGHYRHMPMVKESGEPVGVISIKDLLPLMVDSFGTGVDDEELSGEFPIDLAS